VRFSIFSDTVRMIRDYPLLGIGQGAYRDVFRQYQTVRPGSLFDHAHNDYLETTAEWGIPIAVCFWGAILLIFGRAVRAFLKASSFQRSGVLLASAGSMFALLLHSLMDFNLQIPYAILFFIFTGIAAAYTNLETQSGLAERNPHRSTTSMIHHPMVLARRATSGR
jgi:O-antigen ligase